MEVRPTSAGQSAADARSKTEREVRRACQDMEALFLKQLLSEMHKAGGSMMQGGLGADIYQDLFDQQLAEEISRGQGIGLARILQRQMLPSSGATGNTGNASQKEGDSPVNSPLKLLRPSAEE